MGRKESLRKWHKRNPWRRAYDGAKHRCSKGKYASRGIRLKMSIEDFEYLWFRDKAYRMEKPSIDRINSKGDYTLDNCRFIELYLNHNPQKVIQYKGDKKIIYPSMSEAARKTKIRLSTIARAAAGIYNYAGGYKWEKMG